MIKTVKLNIKTVKFKNLKVSFFRVQYGFSDDQNVTSV